MIEILAAFFLLLSGILFFKRSRKNKVKTAPGPKGIPIFGSLFHMDYVNMHLTLDRFSRQYGHIVQIKIMGQTFICLNSSKAIRDAFLHEPTASLTAARPISYFGKYGVDNYSNIAFGSLSKTWTYRRKLSYRLMNAYGDGMMNLEKEIIAHLTVMKDDVICLNGTTICPEELVETFLLGVLETIMIGRSTGKHGELQQFFKDIDNNAIDLTNMGMDVLYTLLPFLRYLPLKHSKSYTLFEEQKIHFMNLLAKTSEENPDAKGIYTKLMDVLNDEDQHEISYNNVRGMLLELLAGGFNTTRGALLSLVHILATRPDLQKTLQVEVDSIIGEDRMASLQDRENCPMIMAVILETLRYISHIPLAIVHSVSDSCEIDGYFVEKNATIIPNLWTAHHNEQEWNQPYQFIPERFLDESGSLLPSTDAVRKQFLAFSCGKRSCIGEAFAKSRMFLFVATLMQTVTIEEPDDFKLPEFSLKEMFPGSVMQPKPYKVKFVSRK